MQATGAGVAPEGRQDVEHAVAQLAERLPALPMVGVGLL